MSENHLNYYYAYNSGCWTKKISDTVIESPVLLTINGEGWFSFMCTPVDLVSLAIGFIFNEGFIETINDIASIRVCPSGDNIDVWLRKNITKPKEWYRASGCMGGITSALNPHLEKNTLKSNKDDGIFLPPDQIGILIRHLHKMQSIYMKSGGVHSSALSDGKKLIVTSEDIGRHNTLDKIAGRCLLEKIKIPQRILLTTGRISSEMMQKTIRLDAPIVISYNSPSSLSIKMAERWGITLVGYAKINYLRVYTHPKRILAEEDQRALEFMMV
jgi:FdhD protein